VLGDGSGHVQSLIIGALCVTLGALFFMVALLADMITANRKLLERLAVRIQRVEFALTADAHSTERVNAAYQGDSGT
jgi:type VI protein secretion system component VasF